MSHVHNPLIEGQSVLIKLRIHGAPLIPLNFTSAMLMVTEYYSIFDTPISENFIKNNFVDILFTLFM